MGRERSRWHTTFIVWFHFYLQVVGASQILSGVVTPMAEPVPSMAAAEVEAEERQTKDGHFAWVPLGRGGCSDAE